VDLAATASAPSAALLRAGQHPAKAALMASGLSSEVADILAKALGENYRPCALGAASSEPSHTPTPSSPSTVPGSNGAPGLASPSSASEGEPLSPAQTRFAATVSRLADSAAKKPPAESRRAASRERNDVYFAGSGLRGRLVSSRSVGSGIGGLSGPITTVQASSATILQRRGNRRFESESMVTARSAPPLPVQDEVHSASTAIPSEEAPAEEDQPSPSRRSSSRSRRLSHRRILDSAIAASTPVAQGIVLPADTAGLASKVTDLEAQLSAAQTAARKATARAEALEAGNAVEASKEAWQALEEEVQQLRADKASLSDHLDELRRSNPSPFHSLDLDESTDSGELGASAQRIRFLSARVRELEREVGLSREDPAAAASAIAAATSLTEASRAREQGGGGGRGGLASAPLLSPPSSRRGSRRNGGETDMAAPDVSPVAEFIVHVNARLQELEGDAATEVPIESAGEEDEAMRLRLSATRAAMAHLKARAVFLSRRELQALSKTVDRAYDAKSCANMVKEGFQSLRRIVTKALRQKPAKNQPWTLDSEALGVVLTARDLPQSLQLIAIGFDNLPASFHSSIARSRDLLTNLPVILKIADQLPVMRQQNNSRQRSGSVEPARRKASSPPPAGQAGLQRTTSTTSTHFTLDSEDEEDRDSASGRGIRDSVSSTTQE